MEYKEALRYVAAQIMNNTNMKAYYWDDNHEAVFCVEVMRLWAGTKDLIETVHHIWIEKEYVVFQSRILWKFSNDEAETVEDYSGILKRGGLNAVIIEIDEDGYLNIIQHLSINEKEEINISNRSLRDIFFVVRDIYDLLTGGNGPVLADEERFKERIGGFMSSYDLFMGCMIDNQINIRFKHDEERVAFAREERHREILSGIDHSTIIVANLPFLAVGLKYEKGGFTAPVVVFEYIGTEATGLLSDCMEKVCEQHALARSLLTGLNEGDKVPPELYEAVAKAFKTVWNRYNKI